MLESGGVQMIRQQERFRDVMDEVASDGEKSTLYSKRI